MSEINLKLSMAMSLANEFINTADQKQILAFIFDRLTDEYMKLPDEEIMRMYHKEVKND